MPPRRFSRFEFTLGIRDDEGRLFLTDREPYGFKVFSDNRIHVVKQGDSLFSLAGKYFRPEEYAEAALEAAELMRMEINDAIEKKNLLPW